MNEEEESNSDDKENNPSVAEEKQAQRFQKEYVFELPYLFNLEPPIKRNGPHKSDISLGTNATGTTKFTNIIDTNNTERQTGDEGNNG